MCNNHVTVMTTSKSRPLVLPFAMTKCGNGLHYTGKTSERKIPSKIWGLVLFLSTINYGSYAVLIHLSKQENKIPFSSVSVVLLIETFKIVFSALMYGVQRDYSGIRHISLRHSLPFAVPAMLYFINNNLGMLMQIHMDPITSQILSNLKIVSTAVFFRIIIKRHLTNLQWIAILLLTFAGIFHSYGGYQSTDSDKKTKMYITFTGILMISVYCSVSGLAGVSSEFILKKHAQMSLHLQNMMLYCYGILMNFLMLIGQFSFTHSTDRSSSFFDGFTHITWILIFTQVCNGLFMSFIMKHASNILRLFVIASSMMVTTVLSVIFLNTELNVHFGLSFICVIAALYLYNK